MGRKLSPSPVFNIFESACMQNIDNIKLLELVSSRICHDLISPVGAVSNGIEILEELGDGGDSEVIPLIAFSAKQANAKLAALRMAYGIGGADAAIQIDSIHNVFNAFIDDNKRLSQNWEPYVDVSYVPCNGFAKVFLCSLISVAESLPKGGTISAKSENDNTLIITGIDDNARFDERFLQALQHETPISDLEPKFVHAYLTGLFAQTYNFEIITNQEENNFISLRLKSCAVS